MQLMKNNILENLSPPDDGLKGLQEKLNQQADTSAWLSYLDELSSNNYGVKHFACSVVLLVAVTGLSLKFLNNDIILVPNENVDYGIFQDLMNPIPPENKVVLVPSEDKQSELIALSSNNPNVKLYWINSLSSDPL